MSLNRFIRWVGVFIFSIFQQTVSAEITTADEALSCLDTISSAELISLLTQDEGDEAWKLTTTLVDKLQREAIVQHAGHVFMCQSDA